MNASDTELGIAAIETVDAPDAGLCIAILVVGYFLGRYTK